MSQKVHLIIGGFSQITPLQEFAKSLTPEEVLGAQPVSFPGRKPEIRMICAANNAATIFKNVQHKYNRTLTYRTQPCTTD